MYFYIDPDDPGLSRNLRLATERFLSQAQSWPSISDFARSRGFEVFVDYDLASETIQAPPGEIDEYSRRALALQLIEAAELLAEGELESAEKLLLPTVKRIPESEMTLVRRNKINRLKISCDEEDPEQQFIKEFYPRHFDIPLISPPRLDRKIKNPTEKNAFFLCHYSAQRIDEQPTDALVTQTADHWLTTFMDNYPDDHTVACVFRCWLLEYRLPLTPSRLKTWTRFHQRSASVIADNRAFGTQSNKLDELLSDQYRRSHGLPCKRSPSKKSKVSAY